MCISEIQIVSVSNIRVTSHFNFTLRNINITTSGDKDSPRLLHITKANGKEKKKDNFSIIP